jgi:hypothetical protein
MSRLSSTTVLSQLSCLGSPVPQVLSRLSCPRCPVQAVLSLLSCTGIFLRSRVPSVFSRNAQVFLCKPHKCIYVLSLLLCSEHPVLSVLSGYPVLDAFSLLPCPRLSCAGCPVPAVLSRLSCPGCFIPVVLYLLSRPGCPVQAVLFWLSHPSILFQEVILLPSCSICSRPVILFLKSFVLAFLGCPFIALQGVNYLFNFRTVGYI